VLEIISIIAVVPQKNKTKTKNKQTNKNILLNLQLSSSCIDRYPCKSISYDSLLLLLFNNIGMQSTI